MSEHRPVASPPAASGEDAFPPSTPASRLIGTLAVAGAVAGLLIVLAFQWAQPRIEEHQARALRDAVGEVLGAPERTDRLFVYGGRLVPELPAGVDSAGLDRLFVGYAEDGERIGFAIRGAEPGFQDLIALIFGYEPTTNRVLGMKVLDNKETPGLGDKIVKDSAFVGSFRGVPAPLAGVKAGMGRGAGNEVELITGATISARVVVQIINNRIAATTPLIEEYLQEGVP
jgi:Na+-translocating ferredoxin:NAD+ oxidoreductase subunit G